MFEEKPPLMVQFEIEAVGNEPLVNKPSKRIGPSSLPPASVVPLFPLITEFVSEKPVTLLPLMPKFWKSLSCIRVSETPEVLLKNMPEPCVVLPSAPVLCWMVPPVPALPLPVTVRPAVEPVVLRMMPFDVLFAPEPDEMLRNVRPAAPMVVFETLRAVPAVVESVLTIEVLFCVAVTVPPPVAVKESFEPVERLRPPVKAMVAPVLFVSVIPVS